MPANVYAPDESLMIAELQAEVRRLRRSTAASQRLVWEYDTFTITGSGDTVHTLTWLPYGINVALLNGLGLVEPTNYTCDYTTGVITVLSTVTAGDVLHVRYVTTGELKVYSLPADTGVTPADISGLAAWWKADSLSLTDGDAVTTWSDSSGNLRTATTAGTTAPIYKTGIINSKPVVRFTHADSTQRLTASIGISSDTFTIFTVQSKTDSSTSAVHYLFVIGNGSNGYGHAAFGANRDLSYITVVDATDATVPIGTWEGWTSTRATGSGQTGTLYVNGTSVATTTSNPVTPTGAVGIGNKFNGGSAFGGDIAEVVVYDRQLTSTERGQVHAYLAGKYGITFV